MSKTIREIHRTEVLGQWIEGTTDAIVALVKWQRLLERWQDGDGDPGPQDLEAEIAKLSHAGLGEWVEWCPCAGGLDALAEVLTTPSE